MFCTASSPHRNGSLSCQLNAEGLSCRPLKRSPHSTHSGHDPLEALLGANDSLHQYGGCSYKRALPVHGP